MLAMGCFTHTAKSVTLNNPLETFTLGCADNTNLFTFGKNFAVDLFANLLINGTITYFFYYFLRRGICLCEVIDKCLRSVFLFGLTISYLERAVTVGIYGFLLS